MGRLGSVLCALFLLSTMLVTPVAAQSDPSVATPMSDDQFRVEVGGEHGASMTVRVHYGLFTDLFRSGRFGTNVVGRLDGSRVVAVEVAVTTEPGSGFEVVSNTELDLPMVESTNITGDPGVSSSAGSVSP